MAARPDAGAPRLLPLVESKRILITVGSGGVGKTTMAAALALLAAKHRGSALVMTIDPARRLATALGLEELGHEQRPIPAAKAAQAGLTPGRLSAMMLDMKQAFDEMVKRYAPSQESAERLLRSRIYQQLSTRLAGSQEYAAMEKLHAVWQSQSYSLLVLDTPPTANAIDFLDAPRKMVEAVESPAVNLFASAYRTAGKLKLDLLGFGAAYVVRRLARFTGGDFLDDIAAFLSDLSDLLGGLRDRAAQVMELLGRPEVGFIIVAGPDPRSVDEAIALHERLRESSMAPSAFIINRVHLLGPVTLSADELARRICREATSCDEAQARTLAPLLLSSHEKIQVLAAADAKQVKRIKAHCGDGVPYVEVPLFCEDVHDMLTLLRIAEQLV